MSEKAFFLHEPMQDDCALSCKVSIINAQTFPETEKFQPTKDTVTLLVHNKATPSRILIFLPYVTSHIIKPTSPGKDTFYHLDSISRDKANRKEV